MKVATITRHAITNYGSLLQSIATQKILESLGYESEIIDYVRTDETPENWEKTLLERKIGWKQSKIKRLVYLLLRTPESLIAGKKFEKMRKRYLNLSKRYCSPEELKSDVPQADVYMTGSDQVWGPVANGTYDDSYMLSFVPQKKKKIAFAASMGKMIVSDETIELFKRWLPIYDSIAVREDSAVEFLSNLGVSSDAVLDPTLLIGAEEWDKLASKQKKKNYILVYQLHNDPKLNEYARILSKKMNLTLIRVSPTFHQIARGGRFCFLPELSEFLMLIRDASFMVTDSFHGTAFAINYNTPFAEVLPENGTNSRNISILKLTGLEDRVITSKEALDKMDYAVDFSYANEQIEQKRKESISILCKMLS
ncbi:MAG: polysaccharide pyruvyl transferase family protein [Lachnospiraceae bacterium]|nr:polysaccharide pyruvyl transferase family protein [Lachnospiraceae bacterium]